MGAAVQCFVLILILSAQLGLTSPLVKRNSRECALCAPGEYQTSCGVCAPCGPGTYNASPNRETSCHYCSRDCIPDFHLMVEQECNRTSNLRCVCEAGFSCIDIDSHTGNCRDCTRVQKMPEIITSVAPDGITVQTRVSLSTGHSSTYTKPCQPPQCRSQPVTEIRKRNNTQHNTDNTSGQLAVILCLVVALGFIALFILYCVCHPGDQLCFKRAIVKLGNKGERDGYTQKTHLRDTSSVKHQPFPFATNMGSIHVHNAETVVFSLLSQFTGKGDGTRESQKRGQGEQMKQEHEEEEEGGRRGSPVSHPEAPASPSVHLSQEEAFFPSQEQGKECHMSKEEVL